MNAQLPGLDVPTPADVELDTGRVVYSTDRVTVVHGRAELVLPGYATESLDLVVTDPPYGIEWQSGRRADSFDELAGDTPADRDLIARVLAESVRLVGQNRHLYVFGPSDVLAGLKVSDTADLVWNKARVGMGDLTAPWGPAHEPITFAVSKHRHGGKAGTGAVPVRLRKGSVLTFPPPTGRTVRHPSEKPVGLLRELIESSSRQGEQVLDPFAGSGATGVAAILSGRRALLVESDPQWIPLIIDRLTRAEHAADLGGAA